MSARDSLARRGRAAVAIAPRLLARRAWELVVRVGGVDPAPAPRADAGRRVAVGGPRDCSRRTCSSRPGRRWRGSPRRSSSAPRSRSRCTSSPPVDRTLRPLVVGSQAVPIPVVAPLIVFALGFGFAPKILIVALICFFPVVVNVADGLRDSDPDARKLLRSLRRDALAAAALPRRAVGAAGELHRHAGRGERRGDRRRVRGVGGLGVRARPPRDHRQRPARDGARVRRDGAADRAWRSRSTPRSTRSSGASSDVGAEGAAHEAARDPRGARRARRLRREGRADRRAARRARSRSR